MVWIPYAHKREIEAPHDPPIRPIGIILHVDAGDAWSLFNWFSGPSGGIESHFHIRKNGEYEQYRDTEQEADANYKANSFWRNGERVGFISIETQGRFSGTWTAAQMASILRLVLDLSKIHDIPLRVCPGPFEPGVGYHIMFGSPGPWTPSVKSCPGPKRIEQFYDVIVPWMEAMAIDRYHKVDEGSDVLKPNFDRMVKDGVYTEHTAPGQIVVHDRLAAYLLRERNKVTKKMIGSAVAGASVGKSEIVADVVEHIGRALLGM